MCLVTKRYKITSLVVNENEIKQDKKIVVYDANK